MIRTNIYLTKPQKQAAENLASKKGLSLAEWVRRVIDKELEESKKK